MFEKGGTTATDALQSHRKAASGHKEERMCPSLEPSGWAEPAAGATGGTEDDFTPAPKTCPHCHLFYKATWEIEQQGAGWKAEFVLWGRCSNCGGYMERVEKHGS